MLSVEQRRRLYEVGRQQEEAARVVELAEHLAFFIDPAHQDVQATMTSMLRATDEPRGFNGARWIGRWNDPWGVGA